MKEEKYRYTFHSCEDGGGGVLEGCLSYPDQLYFNFIGPYGLTLPPTENPEYGIGSTLNFLVLKVDMVHSNLSDRFHLNDILKEE